MWKELRGGIRAGLDLEPYGNHWWIVADLPSRSCPGPLPADHMADEDWAERIASWFAGTGTDVWVIEREVADPLSYVDLWLTDAAEEHDLRRAAEWLDWFDAHRVEGIGFGLVTARNTQNDHPTVRIESLRQPLAHPFGPVVKAWFARQDWLRERGASGLVSSAISNAGGSAVSSPNDRLLTVKYAAAEGLTLHQEAAIGPRGWDVTRRCLVQTKGLQWSEEVDPILLALVGGCDGSSTLHDQLTILAAASEVPTAVLAQVASVIVPHLVERGFIEPVGW